jgi:asparagine synthase (glutamine-hydrolysing)
MCGIAGIVDFDGAVSSATIERMCRTIRHRGPDNQGVWINSHVGLGHARLSIIDLSSAGNQPMPNENSSQLISYNGEIYNYKELKTSLLRNHQFKSECDTEVLVHLWEDCGTNAIKKLNGIFAFAVWETGRQRLTLVRDPLGIKPLYYWNQGNTLIFASEIKAILAAGVSRELNLIAVAEHFTFQNTFGDKSFYKNICLLPAGHYLQFDRNGIKRIQYSDPFFVENTEPVSTIDEYAHRVRTCFEGAVKRQLLSDVPVGSYLSGGMDTGSIAAVATQFIPGIHSFSCGFDVSQLPEADKVFDELQEAHIVSRYLQTKHHDLVLNQEALEKNIIHTIWHLDEPRMGISYQVIQIAQVVNRYVKVVLSGVGGDELFAGYPWRYQWCIGGQSQRAAYTAAVRFFDDQQLPSLFSQEAFKQIDGYSSWESFQTVMNSCTSQDPVNRALYYDLKTFLNGILIVDDKLNMAHSVEARVPLLDQEMVHLALSLPSSVKLQGSVGKAVLRFAMKGLLPDAIISRQKRGFTPPDRAWIQKFTMPYLESIIFSKKAKDRGIFNEATLRKVVLEHCLGKKDHRFLLWSLASFEWMLRMFFDDCILECPA